MMKQLALFALALFMFCRCETASSEKVELFKGELFLKSIDFTADFYTTPYKNGKAGAEYLELLAELELDTLQKELTQELKLLRKKEMLGKPHFNFAENNSEKEFVTVFLSEEEYEKIQHYNLHELRNSGRKVTIQFYGERVTDHKIKCTEIKKVKKVIGRQQWAK